MQWCPLSISSGSKSSTRAARRHSTAYVAWQPGWQTSVNYVQLEVENVMRWYTGVGYDINVPAKTVTFTRFSAPWVEDKDGARRRIGPDQMVPDFSVTVPLTTIRPAGCSDRWVKVWTDEEAAWNPPSPPPGYAGGGGNVPGGDNPVADSIARQSHQQLIEEQNNRIIYGTPHPGWQPSH
jgi:hypothetical protein